MKSARWGGPRTLLAAAAALAALLASFSAFGVDTSDDRIALSINGSTLPTTNGGGGGTIGWLHNFDADTLAGIGVEHQGISVAQWTLASLNGAITRGSGDARYTFYGEAHEGGGRNGPSSMPYNIEVLGVVGTYFHRLSLQLEDKEVDVRPSHGNLPKVGASYLWNPHIQASLSYAVSLNGNLGTHLMSGRMDFFQSSLNSFVGLAYGRVSPILFGFPGNPNIVIPGQLLREGYVGVTRTLPSLRGDLGVIADFQDLSGSKRYKLTVSYLFHVGHNGPPR